MPHIQVDEPPSWFRGAMREALQPLKDQLNGLGDQLNGLGYQLNGLGNQLNGLADRLDGPQDQLNDLQKEVGMGRRPAALVSENLNNNGHCWLTLSQLWNRLHGVASTAKLEIVPFRDGSDPAKEPVSLCVAHTLTVGLTSSSSIAFLRLPHLWRSMPSDVTMRNDTS